MARAKDVRFGIDRAEAARTAARLEAAGRARPPGNRHTAPRQRDLPAPHRRQRRSSGRTLGVLALALLVVGGAGALSAVLSGGGTPIAPKQSPASSVAVATSGSRRSLQASDAELMGLVPLHGRPAPGFTLTDQRGRTVSLAQLDHTHAVVLDFMDDKCRDVCPLVAQELADAYRDLGPRAAGVVFVGVNVNAAHPAPATLRAFIAQKGHGIASVPSFYYLTGAPAALQKVWKDYGITVQRVRTGTLVHSEGMWFLAPGGAERYQATPFANERKNGTGWLPPATIIQWGKGIAKYAARVAG